MKELYRGKAAYEADLWLYGSLITDSDNDDSPLILAWASENEKYAGEFEVIPETIGHKIPKKDKYGKDLFTGDLIKAPDGQVYEVMFNESLLTYVAHIPDDTKSDIFLCNFGSEGIECVGNKWDGVK